MSFRQSGRKEKQTDSLRPEQDALVEKVFAIVRDASFGFRDEEQVLVISVAAPAAEHRSDIAVDGLDLAEGDLLVTVGEDAVEMPEEELGDLLECRQALPLERAQPRRQEAARSPFVGIGPEVGQLLPSPSSSSARPSRSLSFCPSLAGATPPSVSS